MTELELFDGHDDATTVVEGVRVDHHPRTSYGSLDALAKACYGTPEDTVNRAAVLRKMKDPYRRAKRNAKYWAKPSRLVANNKDEAKQWLAKWSNVSWLTRECDTATAWLLKHNYELPSEIESETGERGSGSANEYLGGTLDQYDTAENAAKAEQHGVYNVDGCIAYDSYERVLNQLGKDDPQLMTALRTYGPHDIWLRIYADETVRADRVRDRLAKQADRMKYRGMDYVRAVGKADELLAQGITRKKATSKAKPIPAELLEALTYDADTDELRWAVARGTAAAGSVITSRQVKFKGSNYLRTRLVYALQHGDPADLNVTEDGASAYRGTLNGTVALQDDGTFDAVVDVAGTTHKAGVFTTEEDARQALAYYTRTLERWGS